MPPEPVSIIIFSGDYDRSMAAFTIANGAAAEGRKVTMFFTFWGLGLLRRTQKPGPSLLGNIFKRLLPLGPNKLRLSRLNFAGLGPMLLRRLIHQQHGQTLADLVQMALDRGVEMVACAASLKLLGISREELLASERVRIGDVHDLLAAVNKTGICLFV